MDSRPIGVYDSGMGGISLWRAIRHSLPNESIVYLGDGKNCPYGDKSPEQVEAFAFRAVETLLDHDCKMIVIACNTATSTAIGHIRTAYSQIPFVGMEPAVKPACRDTKTGVVAVLATKRSLESDMFADTLSKYAAGVEVIRQVGDGFVEIVENGEEDSEKAFEIIKPIVDVMASKGVDKIVLGCTHYPFLSSQILRAIASRDIDIVDPSPAIVRQIEKILNERDIKTSINFERFDKFLTFSDVEYCNKLIMKAKAAII